ncbi:MAG: TonB family protein [Armatimonadetes bacterium]|nr:TonB family protein [Armatimonadota bacterium]NIM23505.1 TonB family protein [Armatimonadota bacterium]NIM67371.1 TonB family protein [Armatimonadota bacterium]NIM75872.1 TonB family protein [Armatimonadota bacterium]NIN05557.1 TonB family protein [Armatimonadota bacterium]
MAVATFHGQDSPEARKRRFSIATLSSLGFHALVVIVVGLLAARASVMPETLIPVELVFAEQPRPVEVTSGSGEVEEPVEKKAPPVISHKPAKPAVSNTGGVSEKASPAPELLTAKSGETPAETGEGLPEAPSGPTYGPSAVGGPLPIYPKDAADQGLEGVVRLSVNIGEDGSVEAVSVERSSGHRLFDEAAARVVREGWSFQPGVTDGKPAQGTVSLTFEFTAGTVKRG